MTLSYVFYYFLLPLFDSPFKNPLLATSKILKRGADGKFRFFFLLFLLILK